MVCLPLHWLGLARREAGEGAAAPTGAPAASPDGPPLEGRARSVAIALFALIMSLNGFVFGVISVQLVPLLEAAGLATAAAVWVASMKGVAQFGGRVVEIVFARNLRAITVGRIAVGILPPSLLLLLFGTGSLPMVVAFTLLMGASQGVITIVRGAVPLALFGAKGYGAVLGAIATPVLVVNAAAPTAFAWIVDRWGWGTGARGAAGELLGRVARDGADVALVRAPARGAIDRALRSIPSKPVRKPVDPPALQRRRLRSLSSIPRVAKVSGFDRPVTLSPCACWKARSADAVLKRMIPSMGPGS